VDAARPTLGAFGHLAPHGGRVRVSRIEDGGRVMAHLPPHAQQRGDLRAYLDAQQRPLAVHDTRPAGV
jgi:hypothetical protein